MKKINKILCLLLAFTCVFTLAGCGEIRKAETAVNGMFTALQSADVEKASQYINLDDLKNVEDKEESLTNDTEFLVKNMFKNLSYKIVSSEKKDSDTVIVKAEITTTDMKPVMGEFFAAAIEYAFSNAFSDTQATEEETNKKMEEMFVAALTKPDLATVTNTVDITVARTEDKSWRIKSDETFANVLLGGLYDAAKEMQNSFNTGDAE